MLCIEIAFAQQTSNKFGLYSLNRNFVFFILSQPIGSLSFIWLYIIIVLRL